MTKLSDGQIAEILATVDAAEIEQAQVALKKTNSLEVRGFATHMVEQHTISKQSGELLVSHGALKPGPSPIATNLQAKGAQVLEKLNAADAASFDATYMTSQVEQHAEVLTMIDDQLLPAVNDPALRDHLTNARAMVYQHLEQARQLQK
jgi:putative membrane protein